MQTPPRPRVAVAALLCALAVAAAAGASEALVPVDVQLAVFANVWKLDRNFAAEQGVTIAVVYQETYAPSVVAKEEVLAAARRAGPALRCVAVDVTDPETLRVRLQAVPAQVFYVAPLRAVDVREVARIGRARGIRTVTGVPAYVEQGIAVGVSLRRNRPLILIHLEAARAEGADFSSQLLALARVVGPRP